MKLDVDFSYWSALLERMGAKDSEWSPDVGCLDPLEELRLELAHGKEIKLDEVESAHGGLLSYKGEQIVLYIMDTRDPPDTVVNDPENTKRFHIFECRTLEDMRAKGRIERYVVTTRHDGLFSVTATDPFTGEIEELEAELLVCKNCISALNWSGYYNAEHSAKKKLWKSFSLENFLAEYSTFFTSRPKHTDKTAPIGSYVADWSRISREYRESKGWICEGEGCGVNLRNHKRLLHVHHRNGVVTDNSPKNLAALCILCHSEQPGHGHLEPSSKQRKIIESLRVT